MSEVLEGHFRLVQSTDAFHYGFGSVVDFFAETAFSPVDWTITNPPFRLAERFLAKALKSSRIGVAMLVRTSFIEGIGRFERIFQPSPPTIIAQFAERVPMVKGRLDPRVSTATSYAWLVWIAGANHGPQLKWIPPCRRGLEMPSDYRDRRGPIQ